MVRAMTAPTAATPPPRYGKVIALAAFIAVALLLPALARPDGIRAQTPDDRAALEALYDATGSAGWTVRTNWKAAAFSLVHTFKLTAATSGNTVGYSSTGFITYGAVRESSGSVTLNGKTYMLGELYQYGPGAFANQLRVQVRATGGDVTADFAGLAIRIGTTTLAIADATAQALGGGRQNWTWTPAAGLIANGDFDAQLLRAVPLGSWHGVTTNGMGRVTGLALGGNGLSGSAPAALGQLTALTSLELDGNSGLTGSIPSAWTALTALTTLDLSGTGVCAPPDAAAITAWLDAIRTTRSGWTAGTRGSRPRWPRARPTRPPPLLAAPAR